MRQIPEADWNLLSRTIAPKALERLSERILQEVAAVSADRSKSFHDRYVLVYQLILRRDDEMDSTFSGLRRSTSLNQLLAMRTRELITEEEFLEFSEETRDLVTGVIRLFSPEP
jgi:hypothetical protein